VKLTTYRNLRKINILLRALDRAEKDVDYYALDLSRSELDRTLSAVPPGTFQHVRCHGLYGTYDDGLEWLRKSSNSSRTKVIMTMGSSIGNFERSEASSFLKSFANILGPNDIILVGVDGCLDKDKVYHAYNDKEGITREFYRNGLDHANRLLGYQLFDRNNWQVVGEFDERYGRHQAFVLPVRDITQGNFAFKAGERIRIERAYKYCALQQKRLWNESGLALRAAYTDMSGQYGIPFNLFFYIR
jgi:L-histidine Nalpha-methyltransferase / hercynylcysteine S-oxide synthase